MRFTSATQLKAWIKNKSVQAGVPANTLLHIYMMERLLERVFLSPYRENIILKGGFLIASMVGIDRRSTYRYGHDGERAACEPGKHCGHPERNYIN
jgi:hypothetical protein